MTNKEMFNAILEEDSVAIMEMFDKLMLERIGMIIEDRKGSIANSLIMEAGRGSSEEEDDCFDFDDDSLDLLDDPEDCDDNDEEDAGDDDTNDRDPDVFGDNTGGE